jgi:hypothetical protein
VANARVRTLSMPALRCPSAPSIQLSDPPWLSRLAGALDTGSGMGLTDPAGVDDSLPIPRLERSKWGTPPWNFTICIYSRAYGTTHDVKERGKLARGQSDLMRARSNRAATTRLSLYRIHARARGSRQGRRKRDVLPGSTSSSHGPPPTAPLLQGERKTVCVCVCVCVCV